MTSKERMMCALRGEKPDMVPVTIHQWQAYHLQYFMDGMTEIEAFESLGMDASATYYPAYRPIPTNDWRDEVTTVKTKDGMQYDHVVTTPGGQLTYQICSNKYTSWYAKPLIRQKEDIYLFRDYYPRMEMKRKELEEHYERLGDGGIARCGVPNFQGGCYQAAQVLFGTEELIYECYDDPDWVHAFLGILLDRKLEYVDTQLRGAKVDLVETGGGGSSDSVISPAFHEEFCLPYDKKLHEAIRGIGLPTTYHTCGGMKALLNIIPKNGCTASETLSPSGVGGNLDHSRRREVKEKLGSKVALIGGMDQIQILTHGTAEQVEKEVVNLFETYGVGGGYIMSACDHFFEAPRKNLEVYVRTARECIY